MFYMSHAVFTFMIFSSVLTCQEFGNGKGYKPTMSNYIFHRQLSWNSKMVKQTSVRVSGLGFLQARVYRDREIKKGDHFLPVFLDIWFCFCFFMFLLNHDFQI